MNANGNMPTSTEAGGVRDHLAARLDELRGQLAQDIATAPEASFEAIGGEVRDPGDESVAIERTGVRNALIERRAGEIGEIATALERLDAGRYGTCTDCGLDIETERLRVLPTASRCAHCQRAEETRTAILR
jgi:RNA polymerase-binding transcription factor DksA